MRRNSTSNLISIDKKKRHKKRIVRRSNNLHRSSVFVIPINNYNSSTLGCYPKVASLKSKKRFGKKRFTAKNSTSKIEKKKLRRGTSFRVTNEDRSNQITANKRLSTSVYHNLKHVKRISKLNQKMENEKEKQCSNILKKAEFFRLHCMIKRRALKAKKVSNKEKVVTFENQSNPKSNGNDLSKSNLIRLCQDELFNVFSFLKAEELGIVGLVCSDFYYGCNRNQIWKMVFLRDFGPLKSNSLDCRNWTNCTPYFWKRKYLKRVFDLKYKKGRRETKIYPFDLKMLIKKKTGENIDIDNILVYYQIIDKERRGYLHYGQCKQFLDTFL